MENETRIALIGIIVEAMEATEQLKHILHDYSDFIGISADMIRHHHENWDGSGYPDGLIGQEIPLAAQIVSSMARYTELTGDEACGREDALAAMEREAGIKINPDIFEICSKISRQLC